MNSLMSCSAVLSTGIVLLGTAGCGGRTPLDPRVLGGDATATPPAPGLPGADGSGMRSPMCSSAAKEPTSLGLLGGYPNMGAIAPLGDRVFVGVDDFSGLPGPPRGRIVEASLGGPPTTLVSFAEGNAVWIVAQQNAVFFPQGREEGSMEGGWLFAATNVARLDLLTGDVSQFDNGTDFATPRVGVGVGNANGEFFWPVYAPGSIRSTILKWDPATRTVETLLRRDNDAYVIFADNSTLYWQELLEFGALAYLSAPIGGNLGVTPIESLEPHAFLEAVDDQYLYYTILGDSSAGIRAKPKHGGESRTIVPGVELLSKLTYAIDDSHIYFVDYLQQDKVQRAPKSGGAAETLWAMPEKRTFIASIAVDACNVYWTLGQPGEIYAMAK